MLYLIIHFKGLKYIFVTKKVTLLNIIIFVLLNCSLQKYKTYICNKKNHTS